MLTVSDTQSYTRGGVGYADAALLGDIGLEKRIIESGR